MPLTPEQRAWFESAQTTFKAVDALASSQESLDNFAREQPRFLNTPLKSVNVRLLNLTLADHHIMTETYRELIYLETANSLPGRDAISKFTYASLAEEDTKLSNQYLKMLEMDSNLRSVGGEGGGVVQGNDLACDIMQQIQFSACFPRLCEVIGIERPTEAQLLAGARNLVDSWVKEKYNNIYTDELKQKIEELDFNQLSNLTLVLSKLGNEALSSEQVGKIINNFSPSLDMLCNYKNAELVNTQNLKSILNVDIDAGYIQKLIDVDLKNKIFHQLAIIDKNTFFTDDCAQQILQSSNPRLVAASLLISKAFTNAYADLNKHKPKQLIMSLNNQLLGANAEKMTEILLSGARVLSHTRHGINRVLDNDVFSPEHYNRVKPYLEEASSLLNITSETWENNLKIKQIAKNNKDPNTPFHSFNTIKNNNKLFEQQLNQHQPNK